MKIISLLFNYFVAFDFVLVFIIGSGAVAVLGIVTSLSMCCISYRSYRCVAFILSIFTFVAGKLFICQSDKKSLGQADMIKYFIRYLIFLL